MLTILNGRPWSRKAKLAAIEKESRSTFDAYFAKSALTRDWFPDRLPQRRDMAKYGHLLSDDTREVLLGFLGVESFVDDYVYAGIHAAGKSVAIRQIYIQWGFEEARHAATFRHCLIDSGLLTQEKADRYIAECAESERWTFQRQTGFEGTPLLGAAYAVFQERQTRRNYTALRHRVWKEYGSPTSSSGARVSPAVAGAIRFVESDEGAHESHFSNILRIYLKYTLDEALEALMKVCQKYRMPIIHLPNGDAFLQAIHDTGLYSPRDVINQVLRPPLAKIGLEDRSALRRAVNGMRALGEGVVVQFPGKPIADIAHETASAIYELQPNGNLDLVRPEQPA